MGDKQWWWSHARRELPGRAAVLVPCITWSSGQKPSLICLPVVVSFYKLTLPSSVLIGGTLLTLPSFVRLSIELTPTWASSGVKDNSSWWKPEAGTWVPVFRRKWIQESREGQGTGRTSPRHTAKQPTAIVKTHIKHSKPHTKRMMLQNRNSHLR